MTIEIKYGPQEELLAIQIVGKDSYDLSYCAPELKNNEGVVLAAIKKHSWSFEYASDELKSNKTFILKALNEGVEPWGLLKLTPLIIQSDIEVMALAIKNHVNGWVFNLAEGDAAVNKELAAKALVKWAGSSRQNGFKPLSLWKTLHPTLKEFFPKDSWHEKAQSYLNQLEQEKQAEKVSGGSTTEDGVVW